MEAIAAGMSKVCTSMSIAPLITSMFKPWRARKRSSVATSAARCAPEEFQRHGNFQRLGETNSCAGRHLGVATQLEEVICAIRDPDTEEFRPNARDRLFRVGKRAFFRGLVVFSAAQHRKASASLKEGWDSTRNRE